GFRAHLQRRLGPETAERMEANPDDRDVVHAVSCGCSLYRPEGVGEHLGAVGVGAERDDDHLEFHTEADLLGIADREASFDPYLVSELDEADAERPERLLGLAARVRLLRQELLRGPGPQRAAARQQVLAHRRRSAPWARRLVRERDG